MSRAMPEAERMRRCRLLFERATAEHCSMDEARRRTAADRWAAADRRLSDKRCGTAAADPVDAPSGQWWQR